MTTCDKAWENLNQPYHSGSLSGNERTVTSSGHLAGSSLTGFAPQANVLSATMGSNVFRFFGTYQRTGIALGSYGAMKCSSFEDTLTATMLLSTLVVGSMVAGIINSKGRGLMKSDNGANRGENVNVNINNEQII